MANQIIKIWYNDIDMQKVLLEFFTLSPSHIFQFLNTSENTGPFLYPEYDHDMSEHFYNYFVVQRANWTMIYFIQKKKKKSRWGSSPESLYLKSIS